jgi:hypothetical protein
MRRYQCRIRDLTNTMVIAQSLFVPLAYQLEIKYSPHTLTA